MTGQSETSNHTPESISNQNSDIVKRITSIAELERYERVTFVSHVKIARESIPKFAEKGFFRNVINDRTKRKKLNEDETSDVKTFIIKSLDDLSPELRDFIKTEALECTPVELKIGYKDLTLEESMKLVSDDANRIMIGFETVGHIAHVNLPDDRLAIKQLIGKIILDKHKHIRTVVNKVCELNNEYRTMEFELLAGEPEYTARVIENKLIFEIDFLNVYWNSRLIQERTRIHAVVKSGDIVVDLFAGVGAFVIYLASKGCPSFANDLNPMAIKCMETNIKLNKSHNFIKAFNKDAREFIRDIIVPSQILSRDTNEYQGFQFDRSAAVHVIMNLPKSAIEFLDVLIGIAKDIDSETLRKCIVHCYCFADVDNYESEIKKQITDTLQEKLDNYTVTYVRKVSPRKGMYCIEFACPLSILKRT
ncbi:bifunctional tRNA (guanine(37)-N(1))-methyltransferase [Babesia duncani]|uniref:tRNA (guanine(37)-N1)-methyltransferase n=1 Tax=Babesia duncani TaxID=323732 RepID=A0AAD9PJF5_9APIC|nr:bifunctional tRNA (guanine(37)-N(1))-methyltransferase [Babesia duncani]